MIATRVIQSACATGTLVTSPGANNPREKPEADFEITAEKIEAGEYCIIHGLWRSK